MITHQHGSGRGIIRGLIYTVAAGNLEQSSLGLFLGALQRLQ
jgi:hypothetical protein